MSEWTNELVDWWVDGWVSYFSLLCYFFTERPLGWATSSLSYFFSEQPLFWATSLSCLPASSFAASATQLFSSRSPHSAFCNVQLQFRVAQEWTIRAAAPMRLATSSCNPARQERRSITNALLRAAVPMRFVAASCKPASHQIDQHSRSVNSADFFALLLCCAPHFFTFFTMLVWNGALVTVSCTFCRPHLPKVLLE